MTFARFVELEIAFGLGMNFMCFLDWVVKPWLDRRRARKERP